MPPKRKRVNEAGVNESANASRSTRSSARIATNNTTAPGPLSSEPVPKKKKRKDAAVKTVVTSDKIDQAKQEGPSQKKKTATQSTKSPVNEDNLTLKKKANNHRGEDAPTPTTSNPLSSQNVAHTASISKQPPTQPETTTQPMLAQQTPLTLKPTAASSTFKIPSFKNESYSSHRSLSLFAQYADSENLNVISPEGFEKLCTDANIPLDGALPLILAWQLDAKEMAKFTKDEWVKGMGTLKISTLHQLALALNELQHLLVLQKPPVKKSGKKDQDPYDRTSYFSYADNPKGSFQKLYQYCFSLAKQEGSRNIDMETSSAFWSVLLVPQYPIMTEVLEFITEKGTYRAVNKDLWSMMLEFCTTVKPSLEDYESDGAWPTLLDDFVTWKRCKSVT